MTRLTTTTILFAIFPLFFLLPAAHAADVGKLFPSPEAAVGALAEAAQAKDIPAMVAIFGPASKSLLEFGDDVARDNAFDEFNRAFDEAHRISVEENKSRVLIVGGSSWPFPVPLVRQGDRWFFDTAAGSEEILNRRIGENELNVIAVSRAYVAAQNEYAAAAAERGGTAVFAQRLFSTSGKKDGLYWPVESGEEPSPLGPLIARAASEGYADKKAGPEPYQGYLFRILTVQGESARGGRKNYVKDGKMVGGFALIAYPSKWGRSGIMTFTVNQDAVVYEKNLGPKTAEIAGAVTEHDPDRTWKPVEAEADS